MSRWIRVQTSIFDHELFAAEPMSEREAWLWLISRAAWKETKHRIGNQMISVPVGSFFCTLRELQNAWKWKSDTRVRTFLKTLKNEEMIALETNAGKTHVTICNYAHYQDAERTENAPLTHEKRTKDTTTPINTSSLSSDVKAQAPAKASVKSELMKVLDEGHADALIDHRKTLKKPMTPHAAKLLACEFAKVENPNAAVDLMISSGWQGFKSEWFQNANSPRGHAPPGRTGSGNAAVDLLDLVISGMEQTNNDFSGPTIEGSYFDGNDDRTSSALPSPSSARIGYENR